jgi:hypothetical protein
MAQGDDKACGISKEASEGCSPIDFWLDTVYR